MHDQRCEVAPHESLAPIAAVTRIAIEHARVIVRLTERRSLQAWSRICDAFKWNRFLQKRTKIVATIGPASRDRTIMRSLFICGRQRAALELFARHARRARRGYSQRALEISEELGIHTAILARSSGPESPHRKAGRRPRPRAARARRALLSSPPKTLQARKSASARSIVDLANDVAIGNRLYLQDGQITLRIIAKNAARDRNRGRVRRRVALDARHQLSRRLARTSTSVTDRDFEHLAFGLEARRRLRRGLIRARGRGRRTASKNFIAERGKTTPVIAKIEKHEALEATSTTSSSRRRRHHGRARRPRHRDPARTVPLVQKASSRANAIARASR
jgi:pyruvate kinase